jgi:hypothetical protein
MAERKEGDIQAERQGRRYIGNKTRQVRRYTSRETGKEVYYTGREIGKEIYRHRDNQEHKTD